MWLSGDQMELATEGWPSRTLPNSFFAPWLEARIVPAASTSSTGQLALSRTKAVSDLINTVPSSEPNPFGHNLNRIYRLGALPPPISFPTAQAPAIPRKSRAAFSPAASAEVST